MMKEGWENKEKRQVIPQARELINADFQEFVGCGLMLRFLTSFML